MAQHQLRTAAQQALEALEAWKQPPDLFHDTTEWPITWGENWVTVFLTPQRREGKSGRRSRRHAIQLDGLASKHNAAITALRAALDPPERTLTDEVIATLWHQNGGFHHHFARAVERWLKGNP